MFVLLTFDVCENNPEKTSPPHIVFRLVCPQPTTMHDFRNLRGKCRLYTDTDPTLILTLTLTLSTTVTPDPKPSNAIAEPTLPASGAAMQFRP